MFMAAREEPPREQLPTPIMRAAEDVIEKWRGRRGAPKPLKELLRKLRPSNPEKELLAHSSLEEGGQLTHTTSIYSLVTGVRTLLFQVKVDSEQPTPTVEITPLNKALHEELLRDLSARLAEAFPQHEVRLAATTRKP